MEFLLSRKKLILKVFIGIFASICFILLIIFLLGPPPVESEFITVLLDDEDEAFNQTNGKQEPVKLDEMSPKLIEATLVVEDKNFYRHFGFDIKRIIKAVFINLQSGELKEGASTISQQYAKNLYLTQEKTWLRKIKEAFYTIRLEMFYSKDEILSGYLNTIYYGHGAYGVEAASQHFFQKHADELTLSEATMLVGIPKGPTYYSPLNDLSRATDRQHYILKTLLENDLISQSAFLKAIDETLVFKNDREDISTTSYFEDVVMKEAARLLETDIASIKNSGYKIFTTLNKQNQIDLTTTVNHNIEQDSQIQVGAISISPKNGAITALIGGHQYRESSFNRAIDAKRMVGSTFKPFVYYTALEEGFTPATTLKSEPTTFTFADNEAYQPKNFNSYYANKPITLAQAIAVSDNIYAVKTNIYVTPEKVIKNARKMGIKSELPNVPSLALGSASISLKEMTIAYGILANGGKHIAGHTINKIMSPQGKVLYKRPHKNNEQILNAEKAFVLTHLLTGMFDNSLNGYTSVTGTSMIPKLTHQYAGKSGTTTYDSWMIGYSPSLVTGVWAGYDYNQPIQKVKERQIAKNVWAQFMEKAHESIENDNFDMPNNVVKVKIDPHSGKLATKHCPTIYNAYFEKGTAPSETCVEHIPKKNDERERVKEEPEPSILFKLFELLKERLTS